MKEEVDMGISPYPYRGSIDIDNVTYFKSVLK